MVNCHMCNKVEYKINSYPNNKNQPCEYGLAWRGFWPITIDIGFLIFKTRRAPNWSVVVFGFNERDPVF